MNMVFGCSRHRISKTNFPLAALDSSAAIWYYIAVLAGRNLRGINAAKQSSGEILTISHETW